MARKKAVAYVRVSSKSKAQTHSFVFQEQYWRNAIESDPELIFAGIYADYGISGKSMDRRPQFLEMIRECERKKIDIVYTKSIQRFGRNTEEMLSVVRRLRDLGVRVIFEKEKIDSFQPNSDLYLTIGASVAENDLRIYSDNQRWSIRKKFADGFISIGSMIYGYRMDSATNTLEIIPEQATVVKEIFELYLQGYSFNAIANRLEREGRQTIHGQKSWNWRSIAMILSNEKYKGCSLNQKTITINGIQKPNNNLATKYFVENSHPAIVSPENFDRAQLERQRRANAKLIQKEKPIYPFTTMIECTICGKKYQHKINNSGKAWQTEIWVCGTAHESGKNACPNMAIKDSVLKEKFVECFNRFVTINAVSNAEDALYERRRKLVEAEHELTALYTNKQINGTAYREECKAIQEEIACIEEEIGAYKMRSVKKRDYKQISEFEEAKVDKFLKKVTVLHNTVTFTFINGAQIKCNFTNGSAGNQKGWLERKLKKEVKAK